MLLPAQMLSVYVTHIGHEESILIARLASIFVNVLHPLFQRIANERFRVASAIFRRVPVLELSRHGFTRSQ